MAPSVVIAGGGFGGYYAARTLEKVLAPQAAHVTLVSDVNFLLYTPLLPGAAAGTLEPRHVVVPLREELRRTELRLARVVGADPARNVLRIGTEEGEEELAYDQLVIALGSVSRTLPIPGLVEHGIGFKTLPEAIGLRNRVLSMLERAEVAPSDAERAACLSFVFVGGGYAGLEGLAELQDFAADVIELYPRSRLEGMRWVLVEAKDRLMTEIEPKLAAFADRELRGRGIEIRTSTTIEEIASDHVRLSGGETIPARTVAWTAGVKAHPVVRELGLPLDGDGRIAADRFLRVPGHPNVWAIGDAAGVPDPAAKARSCPPTAQHALRQGRLAARNVAAALGHEEPQPFTYRALGVFVDMGRHEAVAVTMGIRWRGFPAWFLARSYHLALMPGVKRKLRLMADWTVDLLFSRDTTELGESGTPMALGQLEAQTAGGTAAREAAGDGRPPGPARAAADG